MKALNMLRGNRSCRVWRKHWTCWEGREVVEFDESIEHVQCFHSLNSNSTTSLPSQYVQCFRQTLQLLFPLNMFNAFIPVTQTLQLLFSLNMFNAFVKVYNFSSLPTCSMLLSKSTTSLPSQHVQCFRQTLQLLFPPNMFNASVKHKVGIITNFQMWMIPKKTTHTISYKF